MSLQRGEHKERREGLDAIAELEKLLSSLANEDALKVFIEAEKGIESSTEAIKKLNITQKRYYMWLKRLIGAGLIEKRGDTYVQTMLGRFFYRMGEAVLNAVSQRDHLTLADKLMKSNMFSVEEKEDVLRAISTKELLGPASLADMMHEVKMITDYDQLIDDVIGILENAKKIAHLAANKFDSRVMEATFGVIDRGVKFYFLSSEEAGFSESIQALKMVFLNSEGTKVLRNLLNSKELNVRVLKKNLSYSFIIVDGEYGIIELPHPSLPGFYVAFKFKNTFFCQKLMETFDSLYQKAKVDPRISFAKRCLSFRK